MIGPSRATWEALSPTERQALIERMVSAMSARLDLMGEGRPHARARNAALDRLGQHFARVERHIYIADELPVFYPDEE